MSSSSSIFAPLLILLTVLMLRFETAPAVCRSCTKNCFAPVNSTLDSNGTLIQSPAVDVDLVDELDLDGNQQRRPKRSSDVEFRACSRFQIEMLLIPMAIAMIPLVLCALFFCTCCCGPKESRGKLPEDFLSSLPMSKKRNVTSTKLPSEEIELEWGNGYVARKDSSKTKFSTTVSYIEARRESIWSVTSVASDTAAETVKQEAAKLSAASTLSKTPKLAKAQSCESIKRTRFSDTVSVISVDSLCRAEKR